MKCKHENVIHHRWLNTRGWVESPYDSRENADALVCQTCGHWLPLGPARDTDATAIEVRAAEIAANVAELTDWWLVVNCNLDETHGWRDFVGDGGGDRPCSVIAGSYVNNWHAGHLARAIADHEVQR